VLAATPGLSEAVIIEENPPSCIRIVDPSRLWSWPFPGVLPMSVMTPVSWGELIDKVTILEIKSERIQEPVKLGHVKLELAALLPLRNQALEAGPGLARLEADLKAVNAALWTVEDDIRDCERRKDFGPRFIELARSVYRENDRRALLKHQINDLLDSGLVEEKSYRSY
jgi:hypothetical protein